MPRSEVPPCPDDLSDVAREVWETTAAELDAMGLAARADADVLRCYAEAVVTHRRASEIVARSPILITGQKGNLVRNPALQIQRDAAITVRTLAAEFGLTPSSRSRIEVKGAPAAHDHNPFAG
jgi:P27 family predicted phage terminase small subunit